MASASASLRGTVLKRHYFCRQCPVKYYLVMLLLTIISSYAFANTTFSSSLVQELLLEWQPNDAAKNLYCMRNRAESLKQRNMLSCILFCKSLINNFEI